MLDTDGRDGSFKGSGMVDKVKKKTLEIISVTMYSPRLSVVTVPFGIGDNTF